MNAVREERLNKMPDNNIKKILMMINNSLQYIYNIWLTRNTPQTFDYIMNIKIMFEIYGLAMFYTDNTELDIVKGSYLYSQNINKSKIRTPKNLTDDQKTLYKKHVDRLIKYWTFLGEKFSYEKLSKEIYKNDNDKKEMDKILSSIKF